MHKEKVLLIIVFILSIASVSNALNVIYVDVNGPNDPGTGTFDDPFRKIQDAIDAATSGDIIEIWPGLYTGNGNYNLDPNGKSITIRSVNPWDPTIVANTIIDPNHLGRSFYFHSGEDTNCVVAGFTLQNGATDGSGGAMYCFDSSPIVRNCVIIKNTATWSGGGIYFFNSESTIRNCIIAGNSTLATGGGIRCVSCSNLTIINCTISGNSAGWQQGEGIYCFDSAVSINNSIIWGNGLEQIHATNGDATVTYSDVQNGWSGIGNIDIDPCFVKVGYWNSNGTPGDKSDDFWVDGDYHLKSQAGRWDANQNEWVIDSDTSLCIDAGNPGCPLDDEPNEPNNIRINMGVYGGMAEASKSPANWALLANLTNDHRVDLNDLAVFVHYWLDSGECIPSDLNRSKSVNFTDFTTFADNWLW